MTITPVLSPPVNLRDLGGTPVPGGTVRPGVLWRADDMACVTEDWARQAVSDGLTHIIDLRSAAEVELTGRGPLGRLSVSYHHVPLIDTVGGSGGTDMRTLAHMKDAGPQEVGRSYLDILRGAAPAVVALLGLLAASTGAAVVHCAAGKDRTGVLIATILTVLGADPEVVTADYGRTADNLQAIYARMGALHAVTEDELFSGQQSMMATVLTKPVAELPPMLGADPRSMAAMLDIAQAEDGGVIELLRVHGLTDHLIAALRTRMIAPAV